MHSPPMQSKSAFTIHIPASFQATHFGGKKWNVTNEHTLCIICNTETLSIFQIPSVQTDLGQTGSGLPLSRAGLGERVQMNKGKIQRM